MKKLLTVSLVAVMAVSAAHADIASTTYVDNAVQPVSTKVGSGQFTADTSIAGAADLTVAANTLAGAIKSIQSGNLTITEKSIQESMLSEGVQTKLGQAVAADTLSKENKATIEGLDKAASVVDGEYVSTVVQADGKVSEQKVTFDSTVTQNGVNAPSSGAVHTFVTDAMGNMETAVELKQDKLTARDFVKIDYDPDSGNTYITTTYQGTDSVAISGEGEISVDFGAVDASNTTKAVVGASVASAISDMDADKQDKSNVKYALGSGDGQWIDLMTTLPATCKAANAVCTMVTKGGEMYWEVIAGGTDTEGKIDFTAPAAQN